MPVLHARMEVRVWMVLEITNVYVLMDLEEKIVSMILTNALPTLVKMEQYVMITSTLIRANAKVDSLAPIAIPMIRTVRLALV